MAVKSTDYLIERGTETVQIKRAVKINDKSMNLTVDLKLNHKKGLYDITTKWNYEAVTGDKVLDKATAKVLAELMLEGVDYCKKWREEWLGNQPDEDPEQMSLDLGKED